MVTNPRQTIRQRIKSRMKGLAALLLAVALAVGMMPAVEARADADNYYFIAFVSGYNGILCKGTETMTGIPANQKAFGPWNGDSTGTYYVNLINNEGLAVRDGSTFTEVGKIGAAIPSQAVDLEVSEATNFYFGTTSGYQFYIEVKLDGTSKGTSTGSGNIGKASFTIPAGKYTVQLTSNVNKKWTVDINTAITSLTLSKASLEFTVGDPEQQLTVQPNTAKVKWSSSNPNVASVDDSGKVTPVGVGNADITVALQTDENVKATCKVNVKAKEKPAATVDKPAPTEAPTSVPTATPKPVPKTGDSANPALWLAMMLVALIGFAGLAVTGTMKASRKKK